MRRFLFLALILALVLLPVIALAQTGAGAGQVQMPKLGVWNLVGLGLSAVTGKLIKSKTGEGTKARKRAPLAMNLVYGVSSFLANGAPLVPSLIGGAVQAFTATGLHSAPKNWMQARASP